VIRRTCIIVVFSLAGSILFTRGQSPPNSQQVIHSAPSFKKPAGSAPLAVRVAPMKRAVPSAPHQRIIALPSLPFGMLDELKRQDAAEMSRRFRIGIGRQLDQPIIVDSTNTPSSTWTVLPNGWRVWSLEITSQDALGLRLGLESIHLPAGAQIVVYDPGNQNASATPVTPESLDGESNVWTETVLAETAVLECQAAPGTDLSAIRFSVTSLSHFYRSFVPQPKAGGCDKNVACAPAWLDDAAGVARIEFVDSGSAYLCTGCLLNDTVPSTVIDYFLTANHCIGNQTVANTLELWWFYQASTCNGAAPDINSVPRTGGGATFLSGSDQNDFTFLRLKQSPPDGVTYLGWTTTQPGSETLTCIQHPQGDQKGISFGHKGSPLPGFEDFTAVRWFDGVTEEGSSGSPLLNASHQVVGQLYGGNSACDHLSGTDIFGRFDLSYQMIQPWIDPGSLATDLFPRAKGTYVGLFSAGTPDIQSAGFCTLTLSPKGAYTGSIQLAGKRYAFKGNFDLTDSDASVSRAGNNPLSVHFTLDPSGNADALTGTITDGNWDASLNARRPIFNAHTNPAPFAGSYTVIIPGVSGSQTAPQGYGFGTLKIDVTGKAKFVGSLADGTPVAQGVTISQDGDWPLFGSLYRGQGLLWAPMTIDTSRPSDDIHGSLSWIKAAQNAKYYPDGFDVEVTGIGSLYQKPAAGVRIIDLSDATVTFTGGNLNSFANSVTIGTDNKVADQSANKLSMNFATATGLFKGTATSPDGENVSYKGAAFQKGTQAYGFFLGTDQSGSVVVGP
jgi:hypothetical protein